MLIIPLVPSTPTPPYPWESLESVVSRASRKMNYPDPERLFFRSAFTPRHSQSRTSEHLSFSQEADERFFSYLLGLDIEKIPQLTCDPLIKTLQLDPSDRPGRTASLTERIGEHFLKRSDQCAPTAQKP